MNKIFASIIPLLFLTMLSGCNTGRSIPSAEEWVVHKDGNLTCKLPFKPQLKTQSVNHPLLGNLTIKMYLCEISRNSGLMVSQITYPVPPAQYDVKAGLDGAVQGMAGNTSSKISKQSDISINSIKGKEVEMSAPNKLHARARLFIDKNGPTLYQFQAIGGKKSFLNEKVVNDFFASIELTPLPQAGGASKKGAFQK